MIREMIRFLAAVAIVYAMMVLAARADTLACAPRDDLAQVLQDKWGETSVFEGLAEDRKAALEIFARPDGTWTAAVVTPDGIACPVANGERWQGFMIPQGRAG